MKNDFKNYAVNHLGIPSTTLDSYEKNNIPKNHSISIIEERESRFSIMNVFDRLMKDRIIYIGTDIHSHMANVINAQLLYLNSIDNTDIQIYISSPGGEVNAGLSIYDNYCLSNSKIITTVNGLAASMGSILLGGGEQGQRGSTRFSKVMLHQVSSGCRGTIQDIEISYNESLRLNNELFELLGEFTNKTSEQVKKDADRDLWLSSIEALEYGIIDKIYWSKDKVITLDNLHEVKK
jgi:ATP-dependent Clp protease protease subunit